MTSEELKSWRKRLGFTSQERAAEAIGCSLRSVCNYENGTPIPKYIALACAAVEAGFSSRQDQQSDSIINAPQAS